MDPRRFDDMTRAIAVSRSSRRRVLRSALGGAGSGVVALFGLDRRPSSREAAAVGRQFCRSAFKTKEDSIVTANYCGRTPCGNTPGCFCIQSVGDIPRCLTGFDPVHGSEDCPGKDQCDQDGGCRPGEFCAKVEGCCGTMRKKCLKRCPA